MIQANKKLRGMMDKLDKSEKAREKYETLSDPARKVINLWATLSAEKREEALVVFAQIREEKRLSEKADCLA